jgi:signal recognition particle receptor subunit beta
METLHQLSILKQNGNLKFKEEEKIEEYPVESLQESSGLAERLLSAGEVDTLRKKLIASELTSGKLLILGSNTAGKTDFIHQFNQGSVSAVRSDQDLDFTTIELADDFRLQLFGITVTERLAQIIEKLSENLLGYIFLIDSEDINGLEYVNYIINNLTNTRDVPWTIAVTNLNKRSKKIPAKIKTSLSLPKGKKILTCDLSKKDDIRKVILSLSNSK